MAAARCASEAGAVLGGLLGRAAALLMVGEGKKRTKTLCGFVSVSQLQVYHLYLPIAKARGQLAAVGGKGDVVARRGARERAHEGAVARGPHAEPPVRRGRGEEVPVGTKSHRVNERRVAVQGETGLCGRRGVPHAHAAVKGAAERGGWERAASGDGNGA